MGQMAFTVRMDSDIKKKFDELCKDFGMSANTAFNIFARAVIKQERIPFEVESERHAILARSRAAFESLREEAVANGTVGMSMDEINEEIRLYREERRARKSEEKK